MRQVSPRWTYKTGAGEAAGQMDLAMDQIEQTLRRHLSEEARGTAEGMSMIGHFRTKIEKDTLNVKVHGALTAKKQGHFDEAMLNITEANRDQVTAIRNIQKLLGQARDEEYPQAVFEKFRQFEPFEIGISEADAVLSILAELDEGTEPGLKETISELRDCELRKKDEEGYLSFLANRLDEGGESEDAIQARKSIAAFARTLTEHRTRILEKILVPAGAALEKMPSGIARDRILLELSRNLFLVITSPILTKPAAHVESER